MCFIDPRLDLVQYLQRTVQTNFFECVFTVTFLQSTLYFMSFICRINMDENDYSLIYGVVDELWKNVLKTITQRASDKNRMHFMTRNYLDAVYQLFKVKKCSLNWKKLIKN